MCEKIVWTRRTVEPLLCQITTNSYHLRLFLPCILAPPALGKVNTFFSLVLITLMTRHGPPNSIITNVEYLRPFDHCSVVHQYPWRRPENISDRPSFTLSLRMGRYVSDVADMADSVCKYKLKVLEISGLIHALLIRIFKHLRPLVKFYTLPMKWSLLS